MNANDLDYTFEEITILNALNNASERLTSKQLVAITGIQARKLHEIISRLQTGGELIVANKQHDDLGYKIARTSEDLDAYFKQAQRQIDSLNAKIEGMKRNAHEVEGYKQELDTYLRER